MNVVSINESIRIVNETIKENGTDSSEALSGIVQVILKNHKTSVISENIHKFKIKSEEVRIKIAQEIAVKNAWALSKHIENFGIDPTSEKGQKALIRIAKLAAASSGPGISNHISKYKIDSTTKKGQTALIKIAKLTAIHDGRGVSKNITKYKIDSIAARIEVAKLAARNDGWGTSEHIQEYGIDSTSEEGQKALSEIAIIAVAENGGKTSEFIKNYKIDSQTAQGQKALIKIATIAATSDGWRVSEHIKKYEIDAGCEKGQEVLIEIAKIAAANSGFGISLYIKNYRIAAASARAEIAKIAAANDGWGTSFYIKEYGIKDQKILIEIAKIAATNNGEGTSLSIGNYGICSISALIEVAEIAATNNGRGLSQYIKNYGIETCGEGRKALVAIAKKAAENNASAVLGFIKNYGFNIDTQEGKKAIIEIVRNTLMQMVHLEMFKEEEVVKFFHKFSEKIVAPYQLKKVIPFLELFEKKLPLSQLFYEFKKLCEKEFECTEKNLNTFIAWLDKSYNSIKREYHKRNFVEWTAVLAIVFSITFKTDLILQNIHLLNSIRKMPLWLRDLLTKELFGFYLGFNEERNDLLQTFRNKCREIKIRKKVNTYPLHTEIPCLIFSGYPDAARDACLMAIEKIKRKRGLFREQNNKKSLLETLVLIKNSLLSPVTKRNLIERLFALNGKQFFVACKLIRNLINFKAFSCLQALEKHVTTNDFVKDLENNLSMFFKNTFQLTVENFGEKYAQTFENWRKMDALMTFTGKLHNLASPEKETAQNLLKDFVACVLNNDFHIKRYETDVNPHMALIKNRHLEIFENWKKNLSLHSDEMVLVSKKEKLSIPHAIKFQILEGLSHEHLGKKELYPHIQEMMEDSAQLNTVILENINRDLNSLEEKRVLSQNQAMSKEDLILKKRLLIEKAIIELLIATQIEDIEKKLKILTNQLPRNNVFKQTDLAACMKLLTNEAEIVEFNVVESDHPNDFLLMGTEVDGSCQSVNGSPNFNKCLLAYAWDGKHKLLLIKDLYGNILARTIIRLLVDKKDQPILFQEQIYTAGYHPLYAQNLRKLALKKAADLGVPLVVKSYNNEENVMPFNSAVFAKEKPVSFEYVDASQKIEKSSYFISNVNVISSL